MKTLIIIDMQNDYFPGGRMELPGIDRAAKNAQRLLEFYRSAELPVIHIQHFSIRSGAPFFNPGTPGVEINELLKPLEPEIIIRKNFPNSFRDTALLKELQAMDIKEIAFCGAMSNMCVDAAVRAAFDLGFKCTVAWDACAAKDLEYQGARIPADTVHGAFMAALAGIYASIKTADEIIKGVS